MNEENEIERLINVVLRLHGVTPAIHTEFCVVRHLENPDKSSCCPDCPETTGCGKYTALRLLLFFVCQYPDGTFETHELLSIMHKVALTEDNNKRIDIVKKFVDKK